MVHVHETLFMIQPAAFFIEAIIFLGIYSDLLILIFAIFELQKLQYCQKNISWGAFNIKVFRSAIHLISQSPLKLITVISFQGCLCSCWRAVLWGREETVCVSVYYLIIHHYCYNTFSLMSITNTMRQIYYSSPNNITGKISYKLKIAA